jgi:acylglycerol lipase
VKAYIDKITPEGKMSFTEMEWKSKDQLNINARCWKPETSVKGAICLIHGLGEHSGRYIHLGEFFSSNGYVLLAADLRGHGKSEGQRGHTPSMDVLREDISKQLDETRICAPDSPVFLYGHSLGGTLVLSYCIRLHPQINGVIATGPLLCPGFAPPGWKLALGRFMRNLVPTLAMSNEIDRDGLSRDPQVVDAYNTDPLVHDRVSARLGIDMIEEGLWLLENASTSEIPTLVMHGSADRICSPQASQEYAQKAGSVCTLKIWDGFFHEVHNEPEQDQVLQYALQWMDSHLEF